MNNYFIVLPHAESPFPLASTALAQSGQIFCEQNLKRISDLYCRKQGGPEAPNIRSREAAALLENLEKAPPPSQATVPSAR